MGELKPCPFCGSEAHIWPQARGRVVIGCSVGSHKCSVQPMLHDVEVDAITAWNTRPRTEGRGEGEPVAWAYEYTNHLKGDRAPGGWLRAVAFEAPTRARVNAGFARNVQPLYASPIREPEISREAVIEAIRQHVRTRYERREHHGAYHFSGLEAAADAILNLAPVGGRGEGWRPIETAPRDGSPILAASTNHEAYADSLLITDQGRALLTDTQQGADGDDA